MVVKKNATPADARDATMPFEQALERLEHIVEELEGGTLTLEASLSRYEEGVRLSRRLTQTLDDAEKRVEKLVAGDGDEPPGTVPIELDLKTPESEGGEGQLPL